MAKKRHWLRIRGVLYDKSHIASFDVDAMKGFTPECPDELPVTGGTEIFRELNEQAEFAQFRVMSKDAHPTNAVWRASTGLPQFSTVEGENVDVRWNMHCVPGTMGFELIDGLPSITDYNFLVYKGVERDLHPYGACYHDRAEKISTGVIEFLKMNGVKVVIVGGLATDYCVKLTVLQLLRAGFIVVVNLAACRGIAEETTQQAIEEMKNEKDGALIIENAVEIEKQLV